MTVPPAQRFVFISLRQVLGLYARVMECNIEEAGDQLRDRDGLESALARPRNYATYQGTTDPALLAAVLAHGIAEGQKFIDGNKRTALVALDLFLRLNGYVLVASQEERADWMINLGGDWTTADLAGAIRSALAPA